MRFYLLLPMLFFVSFNIFGQTEKAPIQEKVINYKDWTYDSVFDSSKVNLKEFSKDKKLVLVVYFAPWCPNWKNQAPFMQKLHEKYSSQGLGVIGVGEYDSVEAIKKSVEEFKITFPVVYESNSRDAKQKTTHYEYRKAAGDSRNWGSPWNVFIETARLNKEGKVLIEKTFVVNGELIEGETENFIREKLGLKQEQQPTMQKSKRNVIEPCSPEKKFSEFKKPEL
jgi:peroxiredoxin